MAAAIAIRVAKTPAAEAHEQPTQVAHDRNRRPVASGRKEASERASEQHC